MRLSDKQVNIIRQILSSHGVESTMLCDDLLDHVCCFIEQQLEQGGTFEEILRDAIDDVAPWGLYAVQQQTTILLNSNKQFYMKKMMFLIGALSSMAYVVGSCFMLMHLPGGQEISLYSFLTFVFIFLPMLVRYQYQTTIRHSVIERWKFGVGISTAVLFSITFIFKTWHLRGTDVLLFAATFLLAIGFLPIVFFSLYRKSVA